MVTAAGVAIALAALFAVLLVASLKAGRRATSSSAYVSRRARLALLCSVAGLVAAIVGCKLALIAAYGASVPFLDQWNGEALTVYRPFAAGRLSWVDLAALHNEHRIALTRLLHLGWWLANGQWDGLVQMSANAFIHAWAGAALLVLLWRQLDRRHLDVLSVLVFVVFALPFGWENTLAGFQSSFYLVILLFVLSLAVLPESRAGSLGWWVAVLLLGLSLVTLGSGVLNVVAAACALLLRWRQQPAYRAHALAGLAICGLFLAIAIVLGGPRPSFAATDLGRFVGAWSLWMAWPYPELPWLAWLVWMPSAILVARTIARRGVATSAEGTILVIGIWVVLQGAVISYARAGLQLEPASRYSDFLSLGVIANAAALLVLFHERRRRPMTLALAIVTLGWAGYVGAGIYWRSEQALALEAPNRGEWNAAYTRNLRSFVATGDLGTLRQLPFPGQIPFPFPDGIADLLFDPRISKTQPASIRTPLALTPSTTDQAFVRDGTYPTTPIDAVRQSWGSFTSLGNAATGTFKSLPIRCRAGTSLEIDVAGYVGFDGSTLRLVGPDGESRAIAPSKPARETWVPVYVACPSGPFSVVATDASPYWWFAFRDPVEIGPLSRIAAGLIARWKEVLLVGLGLGWLAARLWASVAAASTHMEPGA